MTLVPGPFRRPSARGSTRSLPLSDDARYGFPAPNSAPSLPVFDHDVAIVQVIYLFVDPDQPAHEEVDCCSLFPLLGLRHLPAFSEIRPILVCRRHRVPVLRRSGWNRIRCKRTGQGFASVATAKGDQRPQTAVMMRSVACFAWIQFKRLFKAAVVSASPAAVGEFNSRWHLYR